LPTKPKLLGGGHKNIRPDVLAVLIRPARQCLRAQDFAGLHVHNGLIHDGDQVAPQGPAQLRGQAALARLQQHHQAQRDSGQGAEQENPSMRG
jgi:hypothetical protein